MDDFLSLKRKAYEARLLAVDAVHEAKSGHPGGSLSCMDALTTLYFKEMNIDPANPSWADRDRFVLSKGHCAPALYAVLALRGYYPVEDLKLLRSIKAHFSGHPDMVNVPGVDMSTGSLGQGLSCAVGMALAAKTTGKTFRTYAICGDGEIEEGQIWEAAMAAAKWKLDKKFEAFNWNVICIDGHDFAQIDAALAEARACKGKPTMIIMKTVKGKGVSFMENNAGWHGKAPNDEQFAQAKQELEAAIKALEEEEK